MTTQSKEPGQAMLQAERDPVQPEPYGPIVLRLPPFLRVTDELLMELSALNDTLRLELNARGELEILAPTNFDTGRKNNRLSARLFVWAEEDGMGEAADSSTGFTLPNGSVRSPDASWTLKSRLADLPDGELHRVPHICPDFVVELRSPSDRLSAAQAKMEEYMANGARLGWLIDPVDPQHRVYVYRPDTPVEVLDAPESLSGDPELPGFVLDLKPIWEPGF